MCESTLGRFEPDGVLSRDERLRFNDMTGGAWALDGPWAAQGGVFFEGGCGAQSGEQ